MKAPVDAPHSGETQEFETLTSDDLSGTTGGIWAGPQGGWGQQYYGQPQYYTVKPGDNLTRIANGANSSLKQILQMNPQYRANPNLIHPGERVLTGWNYPWYYT
jgi:hypothetical protein